MFTAYRDLCKSPFLLRISNFGYKTAPAPPLTLQVNIVASAVFRSKFEMLVDESDFCRGPYILQSEIDGRYYYGFTKQNIHDRLNEHNDGKSSYTNKYKPWTLVWFGTFSSEKQARNFERYLKTPSGHAFSRKRLV